ncbi:unnamed protein product [Rotaria sp. Silwood1]|nr:unnamed protein product [Rotaria sp. Silwood1]
MFYYLYYLIEIFAVQMRITYHGLIYRTILRLLSRFLNRFSSDEITNLFSNDANQMKLIMGSSNYLWSSPLDTIPMTIFIDEK